MQRLPLTYDRRAATVTRAQRPGAQAQFTLFKLARPGSRRAPRAVTPGRAGQHNKLRLLHMESESARNGRGKPGASQAPSRLLSDSDHRATPGRRTPTESRSVSRAHPSHDCAACRATEVRVRPFAPRAIRMHSKRNSSPSPSLRQAVTVTMGRRGPARVASLSQPESKRRRKETARSRGGVWGHGGCRRPPRDFPIYAVVMVTAATPP